MRDHSQAHFLHQKKGLQQLVRPAVGRPTALAWRVRGQELLAATRDGKIHSVDPVMGTRVLLEGQGEVAVLAPNPDNKRLLLVARNGQWRMVWLGNGQIIAEGKHAFVGRHNAAYVGEIALILGNDLNGKRTMLVVEDGKLLGRANVPLRMVVGVNKEKVLVLARSTERGLEVIPFERRLRLPAGEPTAHRLQVARDYVVGLTPSGMGVWGPDGNIRHTMRIQELTSGALHARGRWAALGSRTGSVGLVDLEDPAQRMRPTLTPAYDSPVSAVAFANSGRWLATAADSLRLWTWEADD